MTPEVSVCIVNFNGGKLLDACVASVLGQDHGFPVEVVLVDNASTDGSADRIVARWPEVRLIQNSENVGFGRANNQAMLTARGRFFLLHNNDAELQPGALARMVAVMHSRPRIAFVGPRTLNGEGHLQVTYGPFPSLLEYLPWPRRRLAARILEAPTREARAAAAAEYARRYGYLSTHPVDNVCGVCMLVDRQAASELGLFDERLFLYYEDLEWSARARRAGWEMWYVGDAVIHHAWLPLGRKTPSVAWAQIKRFSQGLYYRQEGGELLYRLAGAALALRHWLHRRRGRVSTDGEAELQAYRRGGAAARMAARIPRLATVVTSKERA